MYEVMNKIYNTLYDKYTRHVRNSEQKIRNNLINLQKMQ